MSYEEIFDEDYGSKLFEKDQVLQQIEQSELKSVQKRAWDMKYDKFVDYSQIKYGPFSKKEQRLIIKQVDRFIQKNDLEEADMQKIIHCQSRQYNIWVNIAKYFPNRTVQQIQRFILRQYSKKLKAFKFGSWTEEEEKQLIVLVNQLGRKWRQISEIIKRTPDNIRGKYLQMGEQNYVFRNKIWTVAEFIQFFQLLEEQQNTQFLKQYYDKFLETKLGENWMEVKFTINQRKQTQIDMDVWSYLLYILKNIGDFNIKWTALSQQIKTKSKEDLRFLWNKIDL
ncbi:hypothetical protein pb186bvf_020594 [Paramecium bursaria]